MFRKFGFTGESQFFRNLGDITTKGFFIGCTVLGTVILSLGGSYLPQHQVIDDIIESAGLVAGLKQAFLSPLPFLGLGVIALGVGAIGTYRDQSRQHKKLQVAAAAKSEHDRIKQALNSAQEETESARSKISEVQEKLVRTWLKSACKQHGLSSDDRVTVYYEYSGEFHLLARHSQNPLYARVHRDKFPIDNGVISRAWQHESCVEDQCPSGSNLEAYRQYQSQEYGLSAGKINCLTMKSCRYYARAISDADEHTGVVVFESVREDFFGGCSVDELSRFCGKQQSQLAEFVRDRIEHDPEIRIKRRASESAVEQDMLDEIGV